jgi:hypothetical protein
MAIFTPSISTSAYRGPVHPHRSPGAASLVAGISLALMAVFGAWAHLGALAPLFVEGDAARTTANVLAAEAIFRAGAAAMVLMAVLDIIVAVALYLVLEPVSRGVALASAAFRVAYTAGLVVAVGFLVPVPALLDEPDLVLRAFESYDAIWQTSLILFAVHLLLIGYLGYRSGFMPRIFGILLVVAGLGYLADGFGGILVPDFSPTFTFFTFVGEVALIIWLLISGRRLPNRTIEGASDVI